MISLTPDLCLLLAPSETYRAIAGLPAGSAARTWWRALSRAAAAAALAGTTTAVAATGRISWALALSGAACWSFLAILQIVTAAAVIVPSNRGVGFPPHRAIELFFFGHAAWSLWLLLAAAFLFAAPGAIRHDIILLTALVPFIWTAVVVFAFFRHVLQLERRHAATRTAIHQALTFLVIILYVGWAVQLWPRVLGLQAP